MGEASTEGPQVAVIARNPDRERTGQAAASPPDEQELRREVQEAIRVAKRDMALKQEFLE